MAYVAICYRPKDEWEPGFGIFPNYFDPVREDAPLELSFDIVMCGISRISPQFAWDMAKAAEWPHGIHAVIEIDDDCYDAIINKKVDLLSWKISNGLPQLRLKREAA